MAKKKPRRRKNGQFATKPGPKKKRKRKSGRVTRRRMLDGSVEVVIRR